MLYQFYETQRSLMEPFADFAQAASKLYRNPLSPLGQSMYAQRMSAAYDLLYRLSKDYETRVDVAEAWLWVAMVRLLACRISHPRRATSSAIL